MNPEVLGWVNWFAWVGVAFCFGWMCRGLWNLPERRMARDYQMLAYQQMQMQKDFMQQRAPSESQP